jgi:hypothetical protein
MMVCVCAIRLPPAGHGGSQHENLVRWPGEPLRLGSTHMAEAPGQAMWSTVACARILHCIACALHAQAAR